MDFPRDGLAVEEKSKTATEPATFSVDFSFFRLHAGNRVVEVHDVPQLLHHVYTADEKCEKYQRCTRKNRAVNRTSKPDKYTILGVRTILVDNRNERINKAIFTNHGKRSIFVDFERNG